MVTACPWDWEDQVAGLRQLHKADPAGRGTYGVVGFGEQSVPQVRAY